MTTGNWPVVMVTVNTELFFPFRLQEAWYDFCSYHSVWEVLCLRSVIHLNNFQQVWDSIQSHVKSYKRLTLTPVCKGDKQKNPTKDKCFNVHLICWVLLRICCTHWTPCPVSIVFLARTTLLPHLSPVPKQNHLYNPSIDVHTTTCKLCNN